MRGTYVVARDYKARPKVLRIWGRSERSLLLLDELSFERVSRGLEREPFVGFHIRDVYRLDEAARALMASSGSVWNDEEWARLTPI